jgi:hypothetical protein
MINFSELKLWFINITILSFSFTNAEVILKVVSLVVLIGYNLNKWYLLLKNKNKENQS